MAYGQGCSPKVSLPPCCTVSETIGSHYCSLAHRVLAGRLLSSPLSSVASRQEATLTQH
jgi:hypothetical protein